MAKPAPKPIVDPAPEVEPKVVSGGAYIPNHRYAEGDPAPDDIVNAALATGGSNLIDAEARLTVQGAEVASQNAGTPVDTEV